MKKNTNNKPSSYQKLKKEFDEVNNKFSEIVSASDGKPLKKGSYKPISSTIPIIQTLYRITTDIGTWRAALQWAEQVQYPVRYELLRVYKEVILDAHLSAIIDLRKSFTLSAEYIVTRDGKEVPELTEKLKSKWFYDFINLALDSIFYGYSLIEFSPVNLETGEFEYIDLVPREYVKPEFSIVSPNYSQITGAEFLEKPWSNWCIGIGDRTNLGLLAKAAPIVIWKRGSIMANAEYSQMFGTPIRVFKTDAYDLESRQSAENFMRNMGQSAYGVIDKDDEIEIISDKRANGVGEMFETLVKTMNDELSKLFLGGTAMIDEKSFVGSSEQHASNFEMICHKDRIFLENIFKYQLVPFLNLHGFGFEGCKIETVADDDLTLLEQFEIDQTLIQLGYGVSASYLNEKYGTEVTDKVVSSPEDGTNPTQAPDPEITVKPSAKLIK